MAAKKIKTRDVKQKVIFDASPHEVYEMLMDSEKHAQFTGENAKISRKVGGRIRAYGGYITGSNLELVPDKRIVQKWHADGWPAGHYSIVTFALRPSGKKALLEFTQTGVPADEYADINSGWKEWYWSKMKEMMK